MDQKPTVVSDGTETRAGSSLLVRILIGGALLALIIGAQCAVAYYVFPSAADVATLAQAQQAGKGDASHASPENPERTELLDIKERHEISLGEFTVTAYQPLSNTTLRIDFQLYGVVLAEDSETFAKLLEENKHRLREQVLVIMRSAELTDLTDAGLGLIKRKILEKTNRVLGRAVLEEVIFSDFSFVEQ